MRLQIGDGLNTAAVLTLWRMINFLTNDRIYMLTFVRFYMHAAWKIVFRLSHQRCIIVHLASSSGIVFCPRSNVNIKASLTDHCTGMCRRQQLRPRSNGNLHGRIQREFIVHWSSHRDWRCRSTGSCERCPTFPRKMHPILTTFSPGRRFHSRLRPKRLTAFPSFLDT